MSVYEVTRLSPIGWNFNRNQGVFKAHPNPPAAAPVTQEALIQEEIMESLPLRYHPFSAPTIGRKLGNIAACIPILNIFIGIIRIIEGLTDSAEDHCIAPEEETKFRVIMVTVGILEVTLIGGIIVHSIASLYFYMKRHNMEA